MNTYVWVISLIIIVLYSVYRMRQEYKRGYKNGATDVLNEWKSVMEIDKDRDENNG